jgi:NitT/TauT family transport system substrate-binding protein
MLKTKFPLFFAAFFFLFLLFFWEKSAQSADKLILVLPPPSVIIFTLFEGNYRFFFHSLETAKEMSAGIFFAFLLAFPLAYLKLNFKTMRYIFQPLFLFTQCLPMFTLAPLMIFWFGWSKAAIIIPTTLMIFFPLTYNLYEGITSVPQELLELFILRKATKWQTFWKLRAPFAMPHFFSGLRISCIIAGIGAIAGEWAGAQNGLGMLMLETRRGADLAGCFSALTCLVILTSFFYASAYLMEYLYKKSKKTALAVTCSFAVILLPFLIFSPAEYSKDSLKISLDWLPNPNHVPLYVGIEKGIFKKHGINLLILKAKDPSDPLPLLQLEKTDLALTYMPRFVRAKAKGAQMEPLAILIKEPLDCLLYRKNPAISSPQDLSNHTIAYCMDGSGGKMLNAILDNNHILPKEQKHASFDLAGVLAGGLVDVISGVYYTIEKEHLKSLGIETDHFSFKELGVPTYYELMIAYKKDSKADTPFIKEGFKRALQESIDFCRKDPEMAFFLYTKALPDKIEKTLSWEKTAFYQTLPLYADNQIFDETLFNDLNKWNLDNYIL